MCTIIDFALMKNLLEKINSKIRFYVHKLFYGIYTNSIDLNNVNRNPVNINFLFLFHSWGELSITIIKM